MVKLPRISPKGQCVACGADRSPWDKFCRNCGTKIGVERSASRHENMDFLSAYVQRTSENAMFDAGVGMPVGAPAETQNSDIGYKPKRRIRMVDWILACELTIGAPLIIGMGGLGVGLILTFLAALIGKGTIVAIAIGYVSLAILFSCIPAAALSLPLAAAANFMGYVFDPDQDRLSFPWYLLRRSILISEIRDANAETITTKHSYDPNTYARLAGDFSWKPTQTRTSRSHVVTVSGDFGVRIMRFGARYKRDQFLSILRAIAPQCRVTRALNID